MILLPADATYYTVIRPYLVNYMFYVNTKAYFSFVRVMTLKDKSGLIQYIILLLL